MFLSLASQGESHENDQHEDHVGVELEDACLQPVGVASIQAGEATQEQAALHGHLHPLDGQHRRPAGGPQLPLWTSKVLGKDKEAETQDRTSEARGVGDGEVGGDHPPVHLPPVHQPGEGGTWVAGGGRAVDDQLVSR